MKTGIQLFTAGICLLMPLSCSEINPDNPLSDPEGNRLVKCESCHQLPQQDFIHFYHVLDTPTGRLLSCDQCHAGYDTAAGWMLSDEWHRNGYVGLDEAKCDLCHDYQDCQYCHDSPPIEWGGDLKPARPEVIKVHRIHSVQQEIACGSCHRGYDLDNRIFPADIHDDGNFDVDFSIPVKPGVYPPYYMNYTCFNVYCHGAGTSGGDTIVMISDAKPQDSTQCSFCHNVETLRTDTLNTPTHVKPEHQAQGIFDDCLNCHRGFSVEDFATVDSLHYNGRIDTISAANCNECHSEPHVF